MYNRIIFLVNQLPNFIPQEIKELILNDYFVLDFNKKIEERLSLVFKERYPNFKSLMKETGCFISGSFIVQCILGETWNNSDIDIYVPTIGNDLKAHHNDYLFSKVDDFMFNDMKMSDGCAESYPEGIHPGLEWVRNYEGVCGKVGCSYCCNDRYCYNCPRDPRRIQIIGIKMKKGFDEAIKFVEETFDFGVCKNIYHFDGNYTRYLKEVILRTTNFKSGKFLHLSLQRCHKYSDRGFVFKNIESEKFSIRNLERSVTSDTKESKERDSEEY